MPTGADDVLRMTDVREHVATSVAPCGCGGLVAGSIGLTRGAWAAASMIVLCGGLGLLTGLCLATSRPVVPSGGGLR